MCRWIHIASEKVMGDYLCRAWRVHIPSEKVAVDPSGASMSQHDVSTYRRSLYLGTGKSPAHALGGASSSVPSGTCGTCPL